MDKIALYIPNLLAGGAERAATKYAEILSKKYEVVFILHENKSDYDTNCKIIDMNLPAGSNAASRALLLIRRVKALRKIKKQNYKAVISFLNNANIINVLAKVKGCKTIVSIRNYYDAEAFQKEKATRLTAKKLYKYADAIVPVTETIKYELVKENDALTDKTFTIYNPFDINTIEEKSREEVFTDEEKAFFENRFIILYVGRLNYFKGLWNLVKAVDRFNNDKNIGLFIIGVGEKKQNIESYINEHNVTNIYVAGKKKNPFPYYKRADVFVLSSIAEGFPNVVGEALACGTPVVATDCMTGPKEILAPDFPIEKDIKEITDARYGVLVPQINIEENWTDKTQDDEMMYLAIKSLYDNEEKRVQYSNKAKERAKAFSYAATFDKLVKVIEG